MAKQIMPHNKKIFPKLLNILGFFIAFSLILILSFYQLFVDSNSQMIGKRNFFKASFYQKLKKTIDFNRDQFDSCLSTNQNFIYLRGNQIFIKKQNVEQETLIYELKDSNLLDKFYVSPSHDKISFLVQNLDDEINLVLFHLDQNREQTFNLGKFETAHIIDWKHDNQDLFIAFKNENQKWQIKQFSHEKEESISIISDITYPGSKLTASTEPINNFLFYPVCQDQCQLFIYNLSTAENKQFPIISHINSSGETNLTNIEILFFDSTMDQKALLAYFLPELNTAIVVDYTHLEKPELWHDISLQPSQETIEIIGFTLDKRAQKRMLFYNSDNKRIYIYNIDDLGLKTSYLNKQNNLVDQQLFYPAACSIIQNNNQFFLYDLENKEQLWIGENLDQIFIY